MTLSKPSRARPLVVGALALLTSGALVSSALAAASPSRGYASNKGGTGLAPVAGKTEEDACRRDGKAVVTRDGKTYCGKPLDAAGETACAKDGGKIVVVEQKKYCEVPEKAAPPPATKP